jgi:hypothetical protein
MVQCVPVDSKNVGLYPVCDTMQTAFYTGICLFDSAYVTLKCILFSLHYSASDISDSGNKINFF